MSRKVWEGLPLLLMLLILVQVSLQAKKQKTAVITDINDHKEFKKLLRTKTNVLIMFVNKPKSASPISETFKTTAAGMKGQATLVLIDCSNSEVKKLCKKLKIPSEKAYYIKHYKDGEFLKDYDRGETVSSMTNFLRDPTGDLPWEEDPSATDVYHLQDADALLKFLKTGAAAYKKSLIMFYAPWCGYCKSLKPEYVEAAGDLKGEALLAAIDVAKPGNSKIKQLFNITGFPTLLYYEKGQLRFPYNGDNKKQAIVDFMKDPTGKTQPKKQEADESWSVDSDVVHLTADNFDSILSKVENALVVFYAPWCGHCKKIKPELEKAAARIKEEKVDGVLCAVDATQERELAARYNVRGYPTLKYFRRGQFQYDAGHVRQEDAIVDFVKSPREPPPPPPPEKSWAEEESQVRHLEAATFRNTLRKIKHALIMFYAPWCGHCKSTKPEFVSAAELFADELMVLFGAVDCTTEQQLCGNYGVKGFPTFKYFSYFDKRVEDYTSGRKSKDFASFIHSKTHPSGQEAKISPTSAGFGADVTILNDNTFEEYIKSKKTTFIMFYATWCTHCGDVKPVVSKLATTLKNDPDLQIAATDAAENPKLADIAVIDILPTFKIYNKGKELKIYDGERTYEALLAFCKTYAKKAKDEL